MIILQKKKIEEGVLKVDYKILDIADPKYNTDGTYKAFEEDLKIYGEKGYEIVQ